MWVFVFQGNNTPPDYQHYEETFVIAFRLPLSAEARRSEFRPSRSAVCNFNSRGKEVSHENHENWEGHHSYSQKLHP